MDKFHILYECVSKSELIACPLYANCMGWSKANLVQSFMISVAQGLSRLVRISKHCYHGCPIQYRQNGVGESQGE